MTFWLGWLLKGESRGTGANTPACVPVTPRDAPEAPGPVVRCGNAHRPTQLSQQPSVCYNGSRWSHGETEAGGRDPVLGSRHWWAARPEGDDRKPVSGPHAPNQVYQSGVPEKQDHPSPPPRNLGLSGFGPTHVTRKIPGQRSSKPVPQESALWLSTRESDS